MTTQADFHPDLADLLDRVWRSLLELKSWGDIYGIYTVSGQGVNPGYRDSDRPALESFLETLDAIRSNPRIPVVIQGYEEVPYDDRGLIRLDELWSTFFHFIAPDFEQLPMVTKRVYVHVAAPYRDHWPEVMKKLVPLLPSVPGFVEVKVGGPYMANRRDQIIAYAASDHAQSEIVKALGELDRTHFTKGVPMCVREVFDGVGIADEPPGVRLMEGEGRGQSFGTYLSQAIWWAVERTRQIETHRKGFLEHVRLALQIVGIDPQQPHLHPERWRIEELEYRGEQAQRKRDPLQAALNWAEASN